MKGNWSTSLYHLVILHEFYAAVQGVEFPIELEGFKYEGVGVPATLHANHDLKKIQLLRSEKPDWFDIWMSTSPNAELQRIVTFKIVDMYSMVVNAVSLYCNSTFPMDVLKVQMHFMSRDDARDFRYEEIFMKYTKTLSSQELGNCGLPVAPWQKNYFEYKLIDVLLYNQKIAKRVARNATIERIPIRNRNDDVVSQFHIHPTDDGKLRSSDVIFVEGYFTISHTENDRIVLGIWANNQVTYHVCLVFAEKDDAVDFYGNILQYTQSSINIEEVQRETLFSANLAQIDTMQ